MEQLQLQLPSEEQVTMDRVAQEQLVELMAEVMLAMTARGKETGDDHPSS